MVHGFWSLQSGAGPSVQLPLTQVSAPLQNLPSEHDVPSSLLSRWQPVAGMELPTLRGLVGLQSGGGPGTHWPNARQSSSPLQRLPSEQDVPAWRKSHVWVQQWPGCPLCSPSSHCSPVSMTPLPQSSREKVSPKSDRRSRPPNCPLQNPPCPTRTCPLGA